jgi:hypothetical protein
VNGLDRSDLSGLSSNAEKHTSGAKAHRCGGLMRIVRLMRTLPPALLAAADGSTDSKKGTDRTISW